MNIRSRRWAAIAAGLSLLVQGQGMAAGFGKKCAQPCTSCPQVISDGSSSVIQAQPESSMISPDSPLANPPAAPATDSTMSDALVGQYDVASSSNFSAPNMIGDFFGASSASLIQIGAFGVGYDSFDNVTGYNRETPITPAGASPGTGGGVGRIKLAENTSILPTDRVFFGYQIFGNVPLAGNGQDVNRFVPGFEKTFFNGKTSIEVRIPFAATLDSTQAANAIGGSNVELGNVTLFFKTLLYTTDTFALGAGVTVTTPTADDFVLKQGNVDLVRIKNQGTHLAPYIGMIYAPGRLFSQLYLQYDVDATGRDVYLANQSGQVSRAGSLSDASVFFTDWNVGYWIYQNQNCNTFITGIAPVFEVHYNQGLGNGDFVANNSRIVGAGYDQFSIVNLTAGSHFLLGQRSSLTMAVVLPVTGGGDRQFDYEFQILFNHVFGRINQFNRLPFNF